jgi:acylphosphatase
VLKQKTQRVPAPGVRRAPLHLVHNRRRAGAEIDDFCTNSRDILQIPHAFSQFSAKTKQPRVEKLLPAKRHRPPSSGGDGRRLPAPGFAAMIPGEERAMGETPKTLRVRVEGRVQGVGYREFARRAATRLHVAGWVRNLADGAVEALVFGAPQAVEALLGDMRAGPPLAKVTALDARETETEAEGADRQGFVILRDG